MNNMLPKTVQDFYRDFNFEEVITNPPLPIQKFLDEEIKFISRHVKQGSKILEVGCGYGRLLNILAEKADKIVGIDFSEPLLEKAHESFKNRKNVELWFMDAQKMSFEDESFDYVLCLDATFGNMPGIEEKVLNEMKRVTKDTGEVVISVFSENAKDAQLENYHRIGLTGIKDDGAAVTSKEGFYSRRFTKKQLQELFERARLSCDVISLCPINYVATGRKNA
ncbi:MAG: hypothetical protein A2675_04180 [Candidatus Yonathbacteria bacterium RIFCSPHIGHO2_01_FULL_51_10]|uniref:Methyltransferase domain-containing protein n=1 Tax=Candidatus Yonathbacteria bacterium RIFCSPHIGHO2_01_FULL_51_10 TaxID=1802723 RepID=A0A1G2S3X3_9BACT|nr:MAG: hypothetical protein A2675_04180 [Candidatus Yonathbacteria bacterium RIFCSPHIGHO2_01_FULL_51_10]